MTDEDLKMWRNPTLQQGIRLADVHFKLCLVLDNQAWFTTQDVTKQWGDDWDDAPYEHNAGPPYEYHEEMDCEPYEIKKVYWDSQIHYISNTEMNVSVETINQGKHYWITDTVDFKPIWPATTLEEFKKLVDVYKLSK